MVCVGGCQCGVCWWVPVWCMLVGASVVCVGGCQCGMCWCVLVGASVVCVGGCVMSVWCVSVFFSLGQRFGTD